MTPKEEAASYTYYTTLGMCVQNNMRGDINVAVGSGGSTVPSRGGDRSNWFDDNTATAHTINGKQDCEVIMKDALNLWGWGTDYQKFLRELGYVWQPDNSPPRWHGMSDGKERRRNFEQIVQKNAYTQNFAAKPPLSSQAWYELAHKNLFQAPCNAKDLGAISSLTDEVKSRVEGKKTEGGIVYGTYYVVNAEGKSENHGISYEQGIDPATGASSSSNVILYGYRGSAANGNGESMSCADLARRMSDSAPAMARYIESNPDYVAPNSPGTGSAVCSTDPDDPACVTAESKSSCQVEGIGWIICPVMTLVAQVVDASYLFVSSLLVVQPLMTTGETQGVYNAWTIMRNFANVMFVIAFLIIIFSQVTSIGLGNYGIKKMLPRLIIAAILVNVSFWICAIAVDISNIIGSSVNGLLGGLQESEVAYRPGAMNGPGQIDGVSTGTGWLGITGFILAGTIGAGLALYVGLSALLPALIAAALAIVTVFLVLTLRQALIILLIVISPLAFVAFLLPNTESLFKKWRGLFQTLLLMYPIIAFIFGASAFASTIVMTSAEGTYKIAIQIMGALIAVLPLALTPLVMKTAGGLLNRFGGIVNNKNRGPFDRMRKSADGYRNYRKDVMQGNRLARGSKLLEGEGGKLGSKYSLRRRGAAVLASGGATAAVNTDQKRGFAKAVAGETAQEYFAQRALGQEGFAENISGSESKAQGLKASAQSQVDKILRQDIMNREVLLTADIRYKNNPKKALDEALASGDKVQANAAINMLMKNGAGGFANIYTAINEAEKNGVTGEDTMESVRDHIKDNGQTFKAKDPALLRWATQDRSNTEPEKQPISLEAMSAKDGVVNKSDAEVAGFVPSALKRATDNNLIQPSQAQSILSNPNIVKDTSPDNIKLLTKVLQDNNMPVPEVAQAASASAGNSNPPAGQSFNSQQTQPITVQSQPQAQTINNQSNAQVLNIDHSQSTTNVDMPQTNNPFSSRVSPPSGTTNYTQNSSGLFTPPSTPTPPVQPDDNTPPEPRV